MFAKEALVDEPTQIEAGSVGEIIVSIEEILDRVEEVITSIEEALTIYLYV